MESAYRWEGCRALPCWQPEGARHKGVENPKIQLRRRQNRVVGLKDEATGNGYSMQYNHRSLRRKPLSHKILNTERVEIFGFLGWRFQSGVSRALFMLVTIKCTS